MRGGATTSNSFYERPILNSPYRVPELHHPLDKNGQPLEGEPRPVAGRPASLSPFRPHGRKRRPAQASLELETYTENALINEIRGYLARWRAAQSRRLGRHRRKQRLLEHWRHHDFVGPQPFFCQLEAVETIIWLTEVAPKRAASRAFWIRSLRRMRRLIRRCSASP